MWAFILLIPQYQISCKSRLKDVETRFNLHILTVFGKIKAVPISTTAIRAYIKKLQEEHAANGSIKRELTCIKRAFNLGKQAGRIHNIPHIPVLKEANARKIFFEPDQFQAIYYHFPEPAQPIIKFGYITGWRLKEIMTLQWPQVDFDARTVRLHISKNDEGRVFPFTAALEELLLGA